MPMLTRAGAKRAAVDLETIDRELKRARQNKLLDGLLTRGSKKDRTIAESAKWFGTFLTQRDMKMLWKVGDNDNLLFAPQLLEDFPEYLTFERVESKVRAELGKDVNLKNVNADVLDDVIERAANNPDSTLLGINAALQQLRELAASSTSSRKKALKDALSKFGLQVRSDSGMCEKFIDGSTSNPLGQVVGIMRIASKLFSYSHRHWSTNKDTWESSLLEFAEDATTWDQATEKALSLPVHSPSDTRRCWNCCDSDHLQYNCNDFNSYYDSDYY